MEIILTRNIKMSQLSKPLVEIRHPMFLGHIMVTRNNENVGHYNHEFVLHRDNSDVLEIFRGCLQIIIEDFSDVCGNYRFEIYHDINGITMTPIQVM